MLKLFAEWCTIPQTTVCKRTKVYAATSPQHSRLYPQNGGGNYCRQVDGHCHPMCRKRTADYHVWIKRSYGALPSYQGASLNHSQRPLQAARITGNWATTSVT